MDGNKPSRADVARAAGVAESTVSRALNDSSLISPAIKDKVRRTAEALGYRPSRQAANFARGRTGTLGLVVPRYTSFPPFSRAYFPTLLDGVVLAAEERGFLVTIVLDKAETTGDRLAEMVAGRSVDGFLFAVSPAKYDRYNCLKRSGVPFALINNYHKGFASVDARPEPGMRDAFGHAWGLRHRRVGYITGDLAYKNGVDRLETFRRLSAEFGMYPSEVEGNFSRTSGYEGAIRLLAGPRKSRPTVIMTASDRAAIGVIGACDDLGMRVPEDVSIIGYDDLHPARDISPQLSTVHNPIEESGKEAATLLIELIGKERRKAAAKWLDTSFVARESTSYAGV
ncbi:MAG: LacI family DNA-binding transcriptional regulator [Spirochaetota bacterium]